MEIRIIKEKISLDELKKIAKESFGEVVKMEIQNPKIKEKIKKIIEKLVE